MRLRLCLTLLTLTLSAAATADTLRIAAASDLEFAMTEVIQSFEAAHPADDIEVTYGSSGKFSVQLQRGAPYDLFFSADIGLARRLVTQGLTAGDAVPYAIGRIVVWSASLAAGRLAIENLDDAAIKRVAIANPEHAPYGKRAEEALHAAGVWEAVRPKLVFGENIAHAAQFVRTGNAEVGIIALALALSPEFRDQGHYWLIPTSLHTPLEQAYIVTARAKHNALAQRFARYVGGAAARAILARYGFELPRIPQQADPVR